MGSIPRHRQSRARRSALTRAPHAGIMEAPARLSTRVGDPAWRCLAHAAALAATPSRAAPSSPRRV